MKVIIAGSRNIQDHNIVLVALARSGFQPTEIVSGNARGVDAIGERIARDRRIPIATFTAPWATHGKAAGPIRNRAMAQYADALVAVWDGQSRGTKNMIDEAEKRGLKVFIYRTDEAYAAERRKA